MTELVTLMQTRLQQKRFQIIVIFIIVFIAGVLRFYSLSHIPPGIHGDEAEWGLIEQRVNRGGYESFFSLGNTGQFFDFSILSYWVQGRFLLLFNDSVFGLRASSAFAGTATVLAFFFFVKLFSKSTLVASLSTLALATSHWHIAYSRLALSNIWTPLFMVLIFYFLYKAVINTMYRYYIVTGLILGFSLYFHHTVKVIPVITAAYLLLTLVGKRTLLPKKIVGGVLLAVIAAFVFLPQGIYYLSHAGTFSPRLNEVSVFNHLPEYYMRYQVNTIPGVLGWQFINTVKVFQFGGDIGYYFYGYQGGLLAPIAGILSFLGFVLACLQWRKKESQLLLLWFFCVVIFGGVITIDAPSSQRILGVIPVLFLFTGIALKHILSYPTKYLPVVLTGIIFINGLWDYNIYFRDYIRSQAGWAQREPATQVAYYLKSLGTDWRVYVLRENTWLYFNHGTVRFLNPGLEGYDIDRSEDAIPIPGRTGKHIVYILPPGSPSLQKLQDLYPTGLERHFYNPIGNTPSFISFEIRNDKL